jgi:hypothetical protein
MLAMSDNKAVSFEDRDEENFPQRAAKEDSDESHSTKDAEAFDSEIDHAFDRPSNGIDVVDELEPHQAQRASLNDPNNSTDKWLISGVSATSAGGIEDRGSRQFLQQRSHSQLQRKCHHHILRGYGTLSWCAFCRSAGCCHERKSAEVRRFD